MKLTTSTLLSLVLFTIQTLSAPTSEQSPAVTFDITDLEGSDLSPDQYFNELNDFKPLNKRQYTSSTYNQLTDGTPCRPVTGTNVILKCSI